MFAYHPCCPGFYQRPGYNADAPDQSGRTPLIIAALKGNREIVTMLLDAGANPNATDRVGETALMKAIESRRR